MISPITNEEKQKLLEATTIVEKINTLESIISFYLHDTSLIPKLFNKFNLLICSSIKKI